MPYDFQLINQSPPPLVTHTNELVDCYFTLKNTGDIAWQRDSGTPFRIATSNPQNVVSGFYPGNSGTGWISNNRIQLPQATVNPGETVTIPFKLKMLDWGGRATQYFQPVIDNVGWFPFTGMYMSSLTAAPVGVFMFCWYGNDNEPNYRWVADQHIPIRYQGSAKDTPALDPPGYYSSKDPDIIDQQLDLIADTGFDYVIIQIWTNDNATHSIDAANAIVDRIKLRNDLKYCFLIDAGTPHAVSDTTLYTDIYNDHNNSHYQTLAGKMLMYTFYPRYPGTGNPNFCTIALSNDNRPGYSNYWADPPTLINGHTSICMRFDNRSVLSGAVTMVKNPALDGDMWAQQRGWAMHNRHGIQALTFASANEEYEGQNNIFPHTGAVHPDMQGDQPRLEVKRFIEDWKGNRGIVS